MRELWRSPLYIHRLGAAKLSPRPYSSRKGTTYQAEQTEIVSPKGLNFHGLTELYMLQPLSRDTCTRVLIVEPSDDTTSPVSLKVEEVDLDGQYEPFIAISHVWGANPRYSRFAVCNGQLSRITGRVDSLLRRLRAKISGDACYKHWNRIWIDTLCIDQGDNVIARREKNHQVSIMHRIFGDAQEVIVDMGASDRFSHLLPAAKQDIIHLRENAFDDEYCKDILGFPSSVKVDPSEAFRIRQSLESCSRLLDKQWMCRIWTVQEFAMARKCSFLLGEIVIDGDLLSELGKLAFDANIHGPSHLGLLFSKFRRALALKKLPQLARMRETGSSVANKLTLGESLGLGWHHDCTDERDTVYALRALVEYGREALKVDYNEPSSQLARRVSLKLIELGDHEAVLSGARGVTASIVSEEEPSWSFLMRPTFKFIGEERHWILSGKPNMFTAGGPKLFENSPPIRMSSTPADHLYATVASIGHIATVSDQLPHIPQYGSNPKLPVERLYTYNTERTIHTRAVVIDVWLRYILPYLNKARKIKHLDRRSEELWRTITHGYNSIESNTMPSHSQQRIDYWNMLVDMSIKGVEALGYKHNPGASLAAQLRALETFMRKRHLLMAELIRKPQQWIDDIHHEFDLLGDPRKKGIAQLLSKAKAISEQAGHDVSATSEDYILRQVALNTYLVNEAFDMRRVQGMDQLKMLERRLAIMQDGRLISVPKLARVGDVVVVLPGISVPYVLRGDHDEYRIVGMAYVDGMMHGEAVNDHTKWEKIKIR